MSILIEVAETHPPQNGKKLAKVKTKGEEFGIWPDKLSALQVGGRYQIEFDESEFKGKVYRKITKAEPASGSSSRLMPEGDVNEAERQFVTSILSAAIAGASVSRAYTRPHRRAMRGVSALSSLGRADERFPA
jgi:hypothetical protein